MWLLLFFWFFAACNAVLFSKEPRLETTDGNLLIVAAQDRSITLATSGSGGVNINGKNLQSVVNDAIAATNAANARIAAFVALQEEVRRMQVSEIEIRTQLAACIGSTTNTSLSPALPSSAVPSDWQSKVAQLEKDLNKNECSSRPCKNGARCLDLFKKYVCLCRDGWEGKRCNKDINECGTLYGTDLGCQNGATCLNTPGSYLCHCPPGYFGRHCTVRTSQCSAGSAQDMCDHGICVPDGASGFKCICDQGWMKTPGEQTCSKDVDECITAPCSALPKVNCINLPGSFQCESCPPGYTGNGFTCDDVNECAQNNGGCSVVPQVACRNTLGSFKCGPCPPGYAGDGVTCEYVGLCRADNGRCHPQATCQEIGTHVQCTCLPGYVGSGYGPNGCLPSSQAPTSDHPCSSSPCLNGRCVLTSRFNYTCQCFIGYSGSRCEVARNPCDSIECANGGTCVPRGNNFQCLCSKSYTGSRCTIERSACGGFLGQDTGKLEFPSSSSMRYRPNMSCAWRIRVNSSLVIQALFDEFDLEPSKNGDCSSDWLQIYDGKEVGTSHMIGKFCGNEKPLNGTVLSSSNNLLFWFKSNGLSNHMGFKLSWKAVSGLCGGDLDGRVHGVFSSPGAPGRYPANRDCYWKVTSDPGQRITFTFFSLNIEQHLNTCEQDFISFHDGGSTDDPIINRWCSSATPAPLVTPGNVAYVHFHSDGISSDRGFQLSYSPTPGIPGCGGVHTDGSGELRPVMLNGRYKGNLDCVWILRAHREQRIKITFKSFSLESSDNCQYDFIEVRFGSDINAPLAGKFCGKTVPKPIVSLGEDLYVRFRSDPSLSNDGFLISYEEVCGGTFTETTGMLQSPLYPRPYPQNLDCIYIIDLPLGKAVRLDFLDFNVEASRSRNCYMDYVEVRDGLDENAVSLGRFCGSTRPGTVIATHNKLWIRFRTDVSISLTGWAANYSSIDTTCGGVLNTPTGRINSPRDNDRYPDDTTCSWVIHSRPGSVVVITFASFHLEGRDSSECPFDYLEISDGHRDISPSSRYPRYRLDNKPSKPVRYCGSKTPPPITSVSNIVYLKFVSDSSHTGGGFQLDYATQDVSTTCGGNFIKESGVLQSPGYPGDYPDDRSCIYIIKVSSGNQIRLVTEDFDLEDSTDCEFDRVEVRNGGSANSPLIGRFCGEKKPPTITSFTNILFIKFYSDPIRTRKGFKMRWDGSLSGCGGLMTAVSGSITSPNYPDPYGRNAACDYRIRVAQGSRIELIIVDLSLEASEDCADDYLEIIDAGRSLGRRCSSTQLGTVVSSDNQLQLKFMSDFAVGAPGFHLTYRTQCNSTLESQRRGVIESPGYPAKFAPKTACVWKVNVDLGHTVNLTFTDFEIGQFNCNDSYIEVHEGFAGEEPSHLLGKYCGSHKPPVLISSTLASVTIALVTDAETTGTFRIEWTSVGCGGELTKPFGQITSPNYPAHYPDNVRCVWTITVDPEQSIRLFISDINLETMSGCSMDALEVYGGADTTSPRLAMLCATHGGQISLDSSGNQMTLVFRADHSQSGTGFSANYSTLPSQCGGRFMSKLGSIHSRDYPQNYKANDDCTWILAVPPNHRINFTFTDFDMPRNDNCSVDYVQVLDGYGLNSSSVLKVCGNQMPSTRSIVSSSNILTVRLRAEHTAKGFTADYKMTCGATILVTEPGAIDFHNDYDRYSSENCTWTLIAPNADGHVTVTVTSIDTIDSDSEYFDMRNKMFIHDGRDGNSSQLAELMGISTGLPIVSSGNSLFISYSPSLFVPDTFTMRLAYTSVSSACGGDYFSLSGMIATPGYPAGYPPSVECVWNILASPGNLMQLSWATFILARSPFCTVDYVEVRKESASGQLLGVFCGGAEPPANLTSDAGFWIKFSSGAATSTVSNKLFLAEFAYLPLHELTGSSGQISNPLYPRPYMKSFQTESWRITVAYGRRIRFIFTDLRIDLGCEDVGENDNNDRVTIYDGFDESAPPTHFCGALPKNPMVSSSNVAFVRLHTYYSGFGSKFKLKWQEIATPVVAPTVNTTTDCGGDISLSTKMQTIRITSPGYPSVYSSDSLCVWKIRAPVGYHLGYRITDIQLNPTQGCTYDYLAVYDGDIDDIDDASISAQGRYCLRNDTMPAMGALEVSSVVTVVFRTSFLPGKPGFSLQVDLDHGGEIEAPNGLIDFNWNGTAWRVWMQAKNVREWMIKVSRGRRIRAKFESFDVAADVDGSCKDKYVMLRNGHHADSPLIGKWCGRAPATVPLTSGEYLFVRIKTPYRTSSFRMTFEEVGENCGGRHILSEDLKSVQIKTPNYPNSPPPKMECVWLIQAPAGQTLQVDFIDRFDLSSTPDCQAEYVEVRDGGSQLADEVGRYCGDAPGTLRSSDYLIYIKYYTNTTQPNNGFSAKVSLEKCGGVIRRNNGTLSSPGYPGLAPNMDCQWTIEVGPYKQMVLTMEDIHMPRGPAGSQFPTTPTMTLSEFRKYVWMRQKTNCTVLNSVLVYEPAPPLPTAKEDSDEVLRHFHRVRRSFMSHELARELYGYPSPARRVFIRRLQNQENMLGVACADSSLAPITTAGNKVHIRLLTDGSVSNLWRGFRFNFTSLDTQCGGTLSTPDGYITSPYYPREVPRPYYCRWTIQAAVGRRITAELEDFDLAGTGMEQRLIIFQMSREMILLDREHPPSGTYNSTSNVLLISFYSRGFAGAAHRGFKLRYSTDAVADCGGQLTEQHGVIEPPRNLSAFSCDWSLPDLLPGSSYVLKLQDARLGNISRDCELSYIGLLIWKSESHYLNNLCGPIGNTVVTLPWGNIRLRATQYDSSEPVTFRMEYSVSHCGGIVNSSALPFTLTSPGYPQPYPVDTHCAWSVLTEPEQTIKVTIVDFDLEESCNDYLVIYNGLDSQSPLIDKFCGSRHRDIVSQSPRLYLEFHSDSQKQGRGIKLTLETNHTACGGILSFSGTELSTPNYPGKYEKNSECEWELHTVSGSHVGLVFTDRFYIEESPQCVNDFLKIYDFIHNDWQLMRTLCGRSPPPFINSTSTRMKVVFRSNEAIEGDGFMARWEKNCGGELDGASGVVTSPKYPGGYPGGLNCEYLVRGHGQILTLTFLDFQLERSYYGCRFDYIEIEELSPRPTVHGIYCGDNMPPPLTSHYDLKVTFKSDQYGSRPGFVFEYAVEKCGGFINSSSSISYSLSRSSPQADCLWDILAPSNMIVSLQIFNFSLMTSERCSAMSLTVLDSDNSTLSRVCGSPNVRLPFVSSGNSMRLLFVHTSRYFISANFKAFVTFTYGPQQGCGGSVRVGDNAETISSPDVNRDGKYEEWLDCHWSITAKDGHFITAKILTMDIDACNSTNCNCDFVELRDGSGPHADSILRTCGSHPPDVIVSSSNQLWLRFSSDGSYSGRGFTIQFSSMLSRCGERAFTATYEVQRLSSPGYPSNYPTGLRCVWMIQAQNVSTPSTLTFLKVPVHIHVVSWDTEDQEQCTNDYLAIEDYGNRDFKSSTADRDIGSGGVMYYGGGSGSGRMRSFYHAQRTLVGKSLYCGSGNGVDFYASSGVALVEFFSNSAITAKGFQLEYSLSACSRNFTRNQGRIKISSFRPGETCVIEVHAPSPNQTIALYFGRFAMASDCTKNYLQISEGPLSTSKMLLRTCGYMKPNPIFSTGANLYVTFFSTTFTYTDIDITYTTTDKEAGCGGDFHNYGGVFTSPKYPENVRTATVCSWTVTVPDGLIVALRFTDFSIGPASTCTTDFIELLDWDSTTGTTASRGRFCGATDDIGPIISDSTSIILRYTRSVHNGGTGWSVTFIGVTPGTKFYP